MNSIETLKSDCRRILELAENATPAPWTVKPIQDRDGLRYPTHYQTWVFVEPSVCGLWASKGCDLGDANFIAASRTFAGRAARLLPALVEALETYRDERPEDMDDEFYQGRCAAKALALIEKEFGE